jgi:eukaryotic-like serine/threonine-protein kinase
MTVSPGVYFGPYEILGPLGAGGMGQVYRARDTRLDRFVALKILPPELADHPGRRERFEREGRAISSLNHPNICAVYDVGTQDGLAFLVMEYLEGETLAHRLVRGPLPLDQVLRCATEIADALDDAHRHGVVHRDLKPSNVMLTPSGTKLLDFGLAKFRAPHPTQPFSTLSMPKAVTAEGTILGTMTYMAPEQLEGKETDARTDIFAFGGLVYELAAGRKAFEATSQAGLMAAILQSVPPPISTLGVATPASLDHAISRCLAKNPDERWQTARDLKAELKWIAEQQLGPLGTSGTAVDNVRASLRRRRIGRLGWSAGAIAILVALVSMWVALWKSDGNSSVMRFSVALPAGGAIVAHEIRTDLAVSPDGRHIAFIATTEGRTQLWVRSFDVPAPHASPGTEGAYSPFWSPDSRFIGFATEGRLMKADLAGGPPRVICEGTIEGVPSWGRDGSILFASSQDGIYRVSAEGGVPTRVTSVDHASREVSHLWPHFLPDGRRFLYVSTNRAPDEQSMRHSVHLAALDRSDQQFLFQADSRVEYAPSGHLLYVHEGTLLARAFDPQSLRLTGEPFSVIERLHYFRSAANAGFSVSETGVLVYHAGTSISRLVWFDRRGNTIGALATPGSFGNVRVSPNGQRVIAEIVDPRTGTSDLWLHEVSRDAPTRFTSDPANEADPVWSPDGRQIAFRSDRRGMPDLYQKASGGIGTEQTLLELTGMQRPDDWSSDGRSFAYTQADRQTGHDLWLLPLAGDRRPRLFLRTRFQEGAAKFSPDGRWLAFVSDESGRPEVYVAPLHAAGDKKRISTAGGLAPRWRRDGRELFYLEPGNRFMAVSVRSGTGFEAGDPVPLFRSPWPVGFTLRAWYAAYDVSADGQRFLVNAVVEDAASTPINVVLNWTAGLKKD